MKIAQRFNAGMYVTPDKVPKGRLKHSHDRITFGRPFFGTRIQSITIPGVETPGYYRDVPPGHISIEFPKGIRAKQILRPRPSACSECEQRALFLCRGSVLLHIRFGAPGHFIGRNILDVRRDVPLVAERIDD